MNRRALLALRFVAAAFVLGACGSRSGGMPITSREARELATKPLSAAQSDAARANGFVVAPNLTATSYHFGYTGLFQAHQPMYLTADAILHALHASFDAILVALEKDALAPSLGTFLDETRAALARTDEGTPEVRADVDLYLAVGASLLRGAPVAPVAGARPDAIARLFEQGKNARGTADIALFGSTMSVDFSMFKPRGHYTGYPELQPYFRATMWLGRTEIRIGKPRGGLDRSALEGTLLLAHLRTPTAARAWKRIDDTTQALIGPPDSMSFPGFDAAMRGLKVEGAATLRAIPDDDVLRALAPAAAQRIGSQLLHPDETPLAFLMLGQRYVFDSHVFSAVTYGALGAKRMMPSPLDVAAAVFDNPAATGLLAQELATYGYKDQLDAIKKQGRAMGPALWKGSVGHLWLGALRELSKDTTRDAPLPAVMKTDAWGRRMLETQLASWAELRHDTILYAKQSMTAMALCAYPDAYVEPYPAFFAAIEELAQKGGALVAALDFGKATWTRDRAAGYFAKLGKTASTLRAIADVERRHERLDGDQLDFLNHMVSLTGRSAGCTIEVEPQGWYADLYFNSKDVLRHKATIADVHTQPTDADGTMVGKVLHVATGRPRLMSVTIDTCEGPRTYRGFVASYYEKVTRDFERLTDEAWELELRQKQPDEVAWFADLAPE